MKVKAVFFDCDGVLLFGNSWGKFVEVVGISKELDKKWWDDYYEKRITFEEWMEFERQEYRKAKIDRKVIEKIFGPRDDEINPEAKDVVDYLVKNNIHTAIVSSGAKSYVESTAKYLGIEKFRYNAIFEYDSDDKLYNIGSFGPDPDMKEIHIKELCDLLGIKPEESIFVGDSTNDYKAFELTKRGIMYGIHPQLAPYAWKRVDDLRKIIDIVEEENAKS